MHTQYSQEKSTRRLESEQASTTEQTQTCSNSPEKKEKKEEARGKRENLARDCEHSPTLLLLPLSSNVQPQLLPILAIPLREPRSSFNQLQHIDPLLEQHDRRARNRQDPGDGAVHLVGAGHLHRGGGEGRGEEERGGWVEGLDGRAACRRGEVAGREAAGWEERGGDEGAAEAEEVEGDEEELVEGAGDEEDGLINSKLVIWMFLFDVRVSGSEVQGDVPCWCSKDS